MFNHNHRAYTTHIEDTLKTPGSGAQGTLYCRALQDLFFTRPLLARAGDIDNFLNI